MSLAEYWIVVARGSLGAVVVVAPDDQCGELTPPDYLEGGPSA